MMKVVYRGNLNHCPVWRRLERVFAKRGTLTNFRASGAKNLAKLVTRWMSVRITRYSSNICVRGHLNLPHIVYSKTQSTAKMFGDEGLDEILLVIEPLLFDSDKYRQRAGAEILSGILRGE